MKGAEMGQNGPMGRGRAERGGRGASLEKALGESKAHSNSNPNPHRKGGNGRHWPRMKNSSRFSLENLIHVGLPWLHWLERGVSSIFLRR